jgi:hypothetical protein
MGPDAFARQCTADCLLHGARPADHHHAAVRPLNAPSLFHRHDARAARRRAARHDEVGEPLRTARLFEIVDVLDEHAHAVEPGPTKLLPQCGDVVGIGVDGEEKQAGLPRQSRRQGAVAAAEIQAVAAVDTRLADNLIGGGRRRVAGAEGGL